MSARRLLVALVCWTLLAGAVAPPATAGGTTTSAAGTALPSPNAAAVPVDGVARTSDPVAVVQANNTTVRHRNPDRRDDDGDLAAVREHLAGEMRSIVVDCSRAVSAGAFDPCERLNESYGDALSKYVEVSRATASDRDDETARELRRTRRESREYARTVRRFRETHEEYREARASGNTSRARRKARDLRDLAGETERTGGNLTRSLRNASRSGVEVSPASRAVNGTTANVTRTVEGIERDLFVATETTARAGTGAVSYLDPLVVTGRVTTANGTAVAGAGVGLSRVRDGSPEERVRARTRTNETGHYRLLYRPVTVPTGTVPFAVRSLPAAESSYLPSNATVTTRVEQVDATLTVLSAPASTAYGDRSAVRVRVTAGTVAVEGLPVTARIAGRRLGTGRTDGDGEAVVTGRLPATVPAGERTLVVGFEASDRAVVPVTGSVRIDVRETATALSATVRATNRSVAVSGRLTTADGRALQGRTVRVSVAGYPIGTLRSGENGSFRGNLTLPAAVLPEAGSAERDVVLVFDGAGGNLARAETTGTVTLRTADAGWIPDEAGPAISVIAALLAAVGGAVLLGRRRSATAESTGARETGTSGGASAPGAAVDPSAALDGIRAAMDAGDYDLVTTAGYRAVRRALAGRVAAGPDATHWEFYGACAADGIDPDRLEAVRRLTERFERVAFAPDEASRSVAAAALADTEAILGTDTGAADGPKADGDSGRGR